MILMLNTFVLLWLLIFLFYLVRTPLFAPLIAVAVWCAYYLYNTIMNQDFLFFSAGTLFILFALILVSVGGIVGLYPFKNSHWAPKETSHIHAVLESTFTNWHYLAIGSLCLTAIGLLGLIRYSFEEYQLFNSILSLFLLPGEFSTDRYGGAQYLPIELKLLSYMIYPSALAVGALTAKNYWNGKTRLIPIILALAYGMIYSSRTVVILTIVAMISSDLAVRALPHEGKKNELRNILIAGTGLILVFPIIFIGLQWLRQGVGAEFIMDDMIQIARSSMTGSISAFSQWFQQYNWQDYGWGKHTFAGPFELLGLSTREQGFFLEFSEVGATHINIYTAFRGLIQDYGFLGSSLMLFIFGLISSMLYGKVKSGSVAAIPLLAICNGWILFSPFISLFVNNSILTGYIIFFSVSFLPLEPHKRFID